jgi:ribosomal protein S27E
MSDVLRLDLVSIEQHEQRMDHLRRRAKAEAQHTGIACRKCLDEEYLYADSMVCASYPPMRWVKCPKCGDRTTVTI